MRDKDCLSLLAFGQILASPFWSLKSVLKKYTGETPMQYLHGKYY